jgi:hypothetical protein
MNIRKYIRKIVDDGSQQEMEKLADILVDSLEYIKKYDDELYNKEAMCIYLMANENQIDRDLAEVIVSNMRPYSQRWSYEEISKIQNDYGLDNYRTEDVYLVMNQGFNDYRDKLLGDDITNYVKYTDAFIDDEDSVKDKITKYFTIIPK